MINKANVLGVFMLLLAHLLPAQHIKNDLRAPAFPLIILDPNTSAWSYTNNLYDSNPSHWSDKNLPFMGVLKLDGKFYRFMGAEDVEMLTVIPNGEDKAWEGKYSTTEPAKNWFAKDFDAAKWQTGKGAFGTTDNESLSKTNWTTDKIWVRRDIELGEDLNNKNVFLEYSHDDDIKIYVNGIEVVNHGGTGKNKRVKLSEEVIKTLKKGKNSIAAYCFNGGANGFLDFGLLVERSDRAFFANTAKQTSVDVQPMQTLYTFQCGDVELKVTFTAPVFLDNLELLSRPINYLSYEIKSPQAKDVELYFEASPNWALNLPTQESVSSTFEKNGITYLKTGSTAQKILGRTGDHVKNDWGYFYLASESAGTTAKVGSSTALRSAFALGTANDADQKGGVKQLALTKKLKVNGTAKGKIAIGYDDVYAIQYFNTNLRPYWNRKENSSIEQQFEIAFKEYDQLMAASKKFDDKFMQEYQPYGKEYAELCALAYRQSIAAHKLVEAPNGDLLWLSKENDSNGSIGTVDITYPSSPLFLIYNPELAKGLANFIFYYSESGKWQKPFPSHDIGTYPVGNGQTYGGDMPIEEGGNMLILTYAIARAEGNADYANKHWSTLTTWADYLVEKGLDPENQLCTDDFAGHFAHNANLSVKAIMGIASYGYLAKMLGQDEVGAKYISKAKQMAKEWEQMAKDGDHYKLTFDKSGTWSQKYNMVWDKIFDMGIFDPKIRETEIKYYLTKQNKYGLPLDSREAYTKTDWIFWTATMADKHEDFLKFLKPVYLFMNESTTRVPMSDWIWTDRPERRGFKARAVVGGYYIKRFEDLIKKGN